MAKKKSKKFFFIQDGGTFPLELIVVIGFSWDEFISELKSKKHDFKKSFIKDIEEDKEFKNIFIDQSKDDTEDFPGLLHDQGSGIQILVIPRYGDAWKFWETLAHELFHSVHFEMVNRRKMGSESEALAYQHGYLLRKIRRKLQGVEKY